MHNAIIFKRCPSSEWKLQQRLRFFYILLQEVLTHRFISFRDYAHFSQIAQENRAINVRMHAYVYWNVKDRTILRNKFMSCDDISQ